MGTLSESALLLLFLFFLCSPLLKELTVELGLVLLLLLLQEILSASNVMFENTYTIQKKMSQWKSVDHCIGFNLQIDEKERNKKNFLTINNSYW